MRVQPTTHLSPLARLIPVFQSVRPKMKLMRLRALLFGVLVASVSSLSQQGRMPAGRDCKSTSLIAKQSSRRREFMVGFAFLAVNLPLPATAVQERNEALCGTGFFTNIWQYKCTDLGDISDEGIGKELSSSETTAADALLSKMNLLQDSSTDNSQTNESAATSPGQEKDAAEAKRRLYDSVR